MSRLSTHFISDEGTYKIGDTTKVYGHRNVIITKISKASFNRMFKKRVQTYYFEEIQ